MIAVIVRWLGCVALLSVCAWQWPAIIEPKSIIPASLLILLFYVLLRPLLLTLLLPLNILLLGLLTPTADGLLLIWAAACTPGFALSYWQGLIGAIALSACYWPYTHYRLKKARRMGQVSLYSANI